MDAIDANIDAVYVLNDGSDGNPVRFGVFEVDLETGELRKHGVRLRLQEKPFQILAALLERPNRLVRREELFERLWGAVWRGHGR